MKVPKSSELFSSLIVACCVAVSFAASSDATLISKLTAASVSTISNVAAVLVNVGVGPLSIAGALNVKVKPSGESVKSSSNAVKSTLKLVLSPAAQVTTKLSPSSPVTVKPAASAAVLIAAMISAVSLPVMLSKSASSALPLAVIVTLAVLLPAKASPPMLNVKAPKSSASFSSLMPAT